jgi:hypothetical protein
MELNAAKCKVMHVNSNQQRVYSMDSYDQHGVSTRITLAHTTSERDLGIQISADLKHHDQVHAAAAKANSMLGLLKHTFVSNEVALWKKLYTTYVRPYIEFAVPVWNPHLKKDKEIIERVQHKATKIPHELRSLDYEGRCARLGLEAHEDRRTHGDLIQKFKFINSIDSINWHNEPLTVPPRANHRLRFHREKVPSCELRHHFFNNRTVNSWNLLPDSVAFSSSVNSFKANYDTNRATNR